LSWAVGGPQVVLETSSNLGAGASWRPVDIPVTSGGNQSSVTLPLDSQVRFFASGNVEKWSAVS